MQIFDLRDDPAELINLYDGESDEWNDLFAEFERLVELHARVVAPDERIVPDPDPETLEELKSLGYVR